MLKERHIATVLVILGTLILIHAFTGCGSRPRETDQFSNYSENIEIEVELGDEVALNDLDRDDIIFTVRNNGDKTVTELSGEVIFYDSAGNEVGREGSIIISENPKMENIAVADKKARWRSLPPGESIITGYEATFFFGGHPELRDKVKAQWDNLTATVVINKIATE